MRIPTIQIAVLLIAIHSGCKGPATDIGIVSDPSELHPSSQAVLNSQFRRLTTIESAEKKHTVVNSRLGDKPVIFGFMNAQWLEFKAKIQPGDELYEFYTPPAYEEMLHGYGGYELVRNGKTIATLITQS